VSGTPTVPPFYNIGPRLINLTYTLSSPTPFRDISSAAPFISGKEVQLFMEETTELEELKTRIRDLKERVSLLESRERLRLGEIGMIMGRIAELERR